MQQKQLAEKILQLNKESYTKIAQHFSVTRNYIWPDIKILTQYVQEGNKVLDIGCGNGRLWEELAAKNVSYLGIDSCANLIDIARERYALDKKAKFFVSDIFDLTLPAEEKFDVIFLIAVFNHFPPLYQKKALKIIHQLLKPQGLVCFTNWNLLALTFTRKSLWSCWLKNLKMPAREWEKYCPFPRRALKWQEVITFWNREKEKYPLYYYAFAQRQLNKLLTKNGFLIETSFYSRRGKPTSWWRGQNIVTIARKK